MSEWYRVECNECGWVGSTEHCGGGATGGDDFDGPYCPHCKSDNMNETDKQSYSELQSKVEQLQADNARLREALGLIASCEKRANGDVIDIAQKAIASTDSSNWLAEQKAQWRREVLEEVYKEVNCGITHVRWALEIIHRMAEQSESKS